MMILHGYSLDKFTPLSPAETRLFEHCRAGTVAVIGDEVPNEQTPENLVRAAFIKFLLLDGDVHERGVRLEGAWISGDLDLGFSRIAVPTSLVRCRFSAGICLEGSSFLASLYFEGSWINGIEGSGAVVEGGVYLKGIISAAGIDFNGGKFAHFYCESAKLNGAGKCALMLDGAEIAESLHFDGEFQAVGEVRLIGASVGGQLSFTGARFDNVDSELVEDRNQRNFALILDGATVKQDVFLDGYFTALGDVSMMGATIQGDLNVINASMRQLDANRITVHGAFNFRSCRDRIGSILLMGSKVAVLRDEVASWGSNIDINGFVYEFIDVKTNTIEERIDWLDAQCGGADKSDGLRFRPQPWRQLQRVLEEMGHVEESRCVGIQYEKRLQKFGIIRQSGVVSVVLHFLYGKLTAFGYRPQWLLGWFLGVWIGCTIFFWWAAISAAVFAPTNPLVFQNPAYSACPPVTDPVTKERLSGNWYLCAELREEYTGFSPMAFSLDLLLPLVDLHQENDWGPLIATPQANAWEEIKGGFDIRRIVRIVMWGEILAGWGFSLLFVAIVSGLTRRSE